jgi:hypothetical protein
MLRLLQICKLKVTSLHRVHVSAVAKGEASSKVHTVAAIQGWS